MNNNINWTPLLLAITFSLGIFLGVKIGKRAPHILGDTDLIPAAVTNKLDEIVRFVNAQYVEDVNQEELLKNAIDNLMGKLDPHSSYISTDEIAMVNDDMDGDFEGIGVEYIVTEDTVNIVSALAGGPSESAGIRAGDKIMMIEDSTVAGIKITSEKLVKKLRGKKGTQVHLAVKRGSQLLNFTIIRDQIPNRSVDAGFMLDERTGYIKVNRFAEKTYKEFMEKIDAMVTQKGMKDLVIDLRGNPGGYLQKATEILNQFFKEKNKLLVYTEGRKSPRYEYKTNGQAFYNIEKVAVLVDESSASASEIVAGALQDWDRATIIGRRSYGKGLVQEQFPLSDGSALRLTIAQYFIPSGRCIQKPYKNNKDYDNDLELRLKNGELYDAEKNKGKDSTKFYTAARRVVYGGGGITPDVFVPLDNYLSDENYSKARSHVSKFVLDNANTWKSTLSNDKETFLNQELPKNILDDFIKHTQKHGIALDKIVLQAVENDLKTQLKARIAKSIFDDETMYKTFSKNDKMVMKALEVLK